MEGKDIRVLETGGRAYLGEKPVCSDHCRKIGLEDLDRDAPPVPLVTRKVYGGRSPFTELALDAVPALERCVQVGDDVDQPAGFPCQELGGSTPSSNAFSVAGLRRLNRSFHPRQATRQEEYSSPPGGH
jgi:hypothetical protein